MNVFCGFQANSMKWMYRIPWILHSIKIFEKHIFKYIPLHVYFQYSFWAELTIQVESRDHCSLSLHCNKWCIYIIYIQCWSALILSFYVFFVVKFLILNSFLGFFKSLAGYIVLPLISSCWSIQQVEEHKILIPTFF